MGGESSSLCVAACESLGGIGGIVFAVAAFAWGEVQRRRARAARSENEQLKQSMRPQQPARVDVVHYSLPPGGKLPPPPVGPFVVARSSEPPPDSEA